MRDYSAISKRLRRYSENCVAYKLDADFADAVSDAADAIEELLAELVTIRNQLPTWISVEDELPEENKQIISYLAYKGMAVLQYENKHFYMQGAFQPLPKEAVTHWMPLPEPPKGVE